MSAPSTNGTEHTPVNRMAARKRTRKSAAAPPSPNDGNGAPGSTDARAGGQGQDGRDTRGRFVRGNAGGPGNPFARQVAAMRQEFMKAANDFVD